MGLAQAVSGLFVDDLQREVPLTTPPTRIVALAPSVTEMLYALGMDREIVAVTQLCDYPPQAKLKPTIGHSYPNIEMLVNFTPDLVLATRESIRADVLAKLEDLHIATYVLDAKALADIPSHLERLGEILGRSEVAERLATDLRRQMKEVKRQTKGRQPVKVLYVLNTDPLLSVGHGSFIHDVIEFAGGANVAAKASVPYPRLSMEVVLKEDPEIILFPAGQDGIPEAEQELWQRWKTISAVKHRRLYRVQSELLNRPGPRLIEGLKQLAELFHPASTHPP